MGDMPCIRVRRTVVRMMVVGEKGLFMFNGMFDLFVRVSNSFLTHRHHDECYDRFYFSAVHWQVSTY